MRTLHAPPGARSPYTPLTALAPTTVNWAQGDGGADGADDGLGRPAGEERPECREADGNHTDAEFDQTPEEQKGHDANVIGGEKAGDAGVCEDYANRWICRFLDDGRGE